MVHGPTLGIDPAGLSQHAGILALPVKAGLVVRTVPVLEAFGSRGRGCRRRWCGRKYFGALQNGVTVVTGQTSADGQVVHGPALGVDPTG